MPQDNTLSTSISESLLIFRLHCKSQRYRKKTLLFYDEKLLPFLGWLLVQSVSLLPDVTPQHLRAYLVHKQTIFAGTEREREASGHTVHGIARALRAYFNFCVSEGWLTASPMKTVKMPRKPKKILTAYTANEIKLLFAATRDDREKTILYVLLDTGIRASECLSIRANNIKWDANSISIIAGKGEKDRIVYFGAKTARHLIRHMRGLDDNDLLFTGRYSGSQLLYNGLVQLLRRIGKRAGIECTAHKFRRTFAINSLRNGMNLYYLARLMGHEDISILKPYLDIVSIDLHAASEQYGVVDNL